MLAPWVVAPLNPERAGELSRALGVSPLTAQLLINRGVDSAELGRRYLAPRLSDLRRPDGALAMSGFTRAVDRLERALAERENIGIFGDYDVDGVTSCALLTLFLGDVGGRVVPRVARRDAGYGFGVADVEAFEGAECKVIVT